MRLPTRIFSIAAVKRAFGDLQQVLRLRRDLPDPGRESRVRHKAFEDRPAIDGDDIAFAQNALLAGDAVHQFLIDTGADRGRIRRLAVVLEGRITSVFLQHFLSSRVEVCRRNAGLYQGSDGRQDLGIDAPRLAHDLQFVGAFDDGSDDQNS